jgi:hypothetical protein
LFEKSHTFPDHAGNARAPALWHQDPWAKVHEKRGDAECEWTPNDQKWQETQKKQEGKGYTGSKRDG